MVVRGEQDTPGGPRYLVVVGYVGADGQGRSAHARACDDDSLGSHGGSGCPAGRALNANQMTVRAVLKELCEDGYVYRFRQPAAGLRARRDAGMRRPAVVRAARAGSARLMHARVVVVCQGSGGPQSAAARLALVV